MTFRLMTILAILVLCGEHASAQIAEEHSSPWLSGETDGFDRPLPPTRSTSWTKSPRTMADVSSSNVNTTVSPFTDQTEPAIAIDPTDSNTIIIGANDDRNFNSEWVYTSHDGGRTWTDQMLPLHTLMEYATDPSLAFDQHGTAFFLCGRLDGFGIPYPRNDVACYRSDDHGDTWQLISSVFVDTTLGGAATLADKYYMTIDNAPASPWIDRLYATWVDEADGDTLTRIVCASSSDGGYHWSERTYVTPDESFYQSPIPAVGKNGELFISFIDILRKQIDVAVSTDGGSTFAVHNVAGYNDLGPMLPPNDSHGFPIIKGNLAVNSFPSIAADTRPTSTGAAYITWAGKTNDGYPMVWLSRSEDAGAEWSLPTAVTEYPSKPLDRFFPWVAVDQHTGHVGIAYYDSKLDTSNTFCDLFLAVSSDLGSTFRTRQITTAASNPTVGRDVRQVRGWDFKFFGDYIGLAAQNEIWRPVWCDSRQGDDLEIYTASVNETEGAVEPNEQRDLVVTPTTSYSGRGLLISGYEGLAHISITDVLGRSIYSHAIHVSGATNVSVGQQADRATAPLFYQVTLQSEGQLVTRTGRLR